MKSGLEYEGVNIIVPVIASFSTSGEMIPVRVRIGSEVYKIENIIEKRTGTTWGCSYICEIMDNELVKKIKLVFNKETMIWKMGV